MVSCGNMTVTEQFKLRKEERISGTFPTMFSDPSKQNPTTRNEFLKSFNFT